MTCSIYCHSGRQPCPSAWLCKEGCNFNNAALTLTAKIPEPMQSAQERAAIEFWAELPVKFAGPEPEAVQGYPFAWLDKLLNQWDDLTWWQKVLAVLGLIVVCGMVAGVLTGYGK